MGNLEGKFKGHEKKVIEWAIWKLKEGGTRAKKGFAKDRWPIQCVMWEPC